MYSFSYSRLYLQTGWWTVKEIPLDTILKEGHILRKASLHNFLVMMFAFSLWDFAVDVWRENERNKQQIPTNLRFFTKEFFLMLLCFLSFWKKVQKFKVERSICANDLIQLRENLGKKIK